MTELGKSHYITVNGLKTFYLTVGRGRPLLLIHGAAPGTATEISWQLNIEPLANAGFTVYAFDQPGFGRTDNPRDHSLEHRVVHARAFIRSLQLDRFHLIGNSVGAYIAARIALEDQASRRLVLVSSSTIAPKGSAQAQAIAQQHSRELKEYVPSIDNMGALTRGTLFNEALITETLVAERYAMSIGKNYEAQVARKATPSARPIHDELRNLKSKTLILWGNNDRGATVERALLLFQQIPNAELHIFDRCAHWVQWDQAARFNQLVVDFLHASS